MPDFRVSDTAPDHPKMRAAGPAALGLWAMAGAYSMSPTQMTDGWVPDYWVATWPAGKRLAARLVEVGLWTREKRGELPGYIFHDFLDYQRSASTVEEERQKARDRMARLRSGRSPSVRPNTPRTSSRTEHERAPNVHDSLTLTHTHGGQVGGESPSSAPARENDPPPPRCPQHLDQDGDPGPCRACGDARRARDVWDAEADRRDAERRSAEARKRAEDRARAAANCDLCDERGYRGNRVCDHDPESIDRAQRGSAAVRAALGGRSAS